MDRPITDVSVKGRGAVEHLEHRRGTPEVSHGWYPCPRCRRRRMSDHRSPRKRPRGSARVARGVPRRSNPRAKQIRHVRHPPSLPRRDVAVRRLCGCAVREPRRDGRSDGAVVHDGAEAAHGAGQRARGSEEGDHDPCALHLVWGSHLARRGPSGTVLARSGPPRECGLRAFGFHPSVVRVVPRCLERRNPPSTAYRPSVLPGHRGSLAERCDHDRQPSEKWHRAAPRPPGARAKF